MTEPGYPVSERGAQFAGARVVELPLLEAHGFLPDLDAVPDETWARAALVWVNYPNNPTGAVAPLAFYERLAGARARARLRARVRRGVHASSGSTSRPASALAAARPRRTSSCSTRSRSARR